MKNSILVIARYADGVYIGQYLIHAYMKRSVFTGNSLIFFLWWSVNGLIWVLKLPKEFNGHVQKTKKYLYQRFLISIVIYRKFSSRNPLFWTFSPCL